MMGKKKKHKGNVILQVVFKNEDEFEAGCDIEYISVIPYAVSSAIGLMIGLLKMNGMNKEEIQDAIKGIVAKAWSEAIDE